MGDIRTGGKSVRVTLTSTHQKGDYTVADGFHGLLLDGGSSGDQVAMDISQQVVEVTVAPSVTANVGDILYITDAGVITNTSSGNRAALKVVVAKDANNVVYALQLPQS